MTTATRLTAIAATCALTLSTAAAADPWSDEMTFSAGLDGAGRTLIFAEGVISPDTPQKFADFAYAIDAPVGTIVALNSPGGSAGAGIELGYMIRDFGFDTAIGRNPMNDPWTLSPLVSLAKALSDGSGYLSAECFSACAMAFLGGGLRQVAGDSVYGVHQISIDCTYSSVYDNCASPESAFESGQYVSAAMVGYLHDMGIAMDLFVVVATTPPENMTVLPMFDLIYFNVVNG